MTVREYAMKLLLDCGCDLNCYTNGYNLAMQDLISYALQNNIEYDFKIKDIAAALRDIGDEQPEPVVIHKPFCLIWDNGECIDGIECDTLEDAIDTAREIYIGWTVSEMFNWSYNEDWMPSPTRSEIESFDCMIEDCICYIVKWKEEACEYEDAECAIYLSDEELNDIGWDYWENIERKYI